MIHPSNDPPNPELRWYVVTFTDQHRITRLVRIEATNGHSAYAICSAKYGNLIHRFKSVSVLQRYDDFPLLDPK